MGANEQRVLEARKYADTELEASTITNVEKKTRLGEEEKVQNEDVTSGREMGLGLGDMISEIETSLNNVL